MREGSKAVWNFSENSSILETSSVPYKLGKTLWLTVCIIFAAIISNYFPPHDIWLWHVCASKKLMIMLKATSGILPTGWMLTMNSHWMTESISISKKLLDPISDTGQRPNCNIFECSLNKYLLFSCHLTVATLESTLSAAMWRNSSAICWDFPT